jgi:hypothetical protein
MTESEKQFIRDSIKTAIAEALSSQDYYDKLIELVEKITSVNTQMIGNQKDLKILIEEQVLPAFECVNFPNSDLLKKTCEDTQLLYFGEKFKLMDMVQDIQESGITRWIKRIVIFFWVFLGAIGLTDIAPKVYNLIKGLL